MTAPLRRYTIAEYLAFERAAEGRHEYDDGYIRAVPGAREAHVLIALNVAGALRTRLRGRGCRTYAMDMRVRAGSGRLHTYPDVVALCGKPVFADGELDTLLNPSAIVEVLSDSTEAYDRGDKFARYRAIGTLREYVLVSQHEMLVECFVRGEADAWTLTVLAGPDAVLALPSVGCAVPPAEVYEDVELIPRSPQLSVIREPEAPAYVAEGAP